MLANYKRLSQEVPFDGKRCRVTRDRVEITEGTSHPTSPSRALPSPIRTFEVVHVKDVIAMVLIDVDTKKVVLNENTRYPVGERFLEVIAGQIEPGQTAEDAVRAEAQQESGYEVTQMQKLGDFYTSPGLLTEKCGIFLVYGKRTGTKALEEMEDLENRHFDASEIAALLGTGQIRDLKTAYALTVYLMAGATLAARKSR
jgi:ADP-ribose pyrophosphatase